MEIQSLQNMGQYFHYNLIKRQLVPRVYHSFKVEEGSPDFLEYYFATKLPDRELGKLISSGARMRWTIRILAITNLWEYECSFPSVEEQKQISELFSEPRLLSSLFTSARQIFIKNPISTLSHRKPIKNYKC